MKRTRSILAVLGPLGVLGAIAGGPVVAYLSGCKVMESTFDTIGNAAGDSAVGDMAHGIARAAEAAKTYTPYQKHFIGRAVSAEIISRYPVHEDARLTEYVNLVGQAIIASNPDALQTYSGYHFTVLEGDEVNAVSAPAGFIFLTFGTIKRAANEDELAAVLAHEIAHVSLEHGIKAIKAATWKQSGVLFARGAGKAGAAAAGTQGEEMKALGELTANFANVVSDITGNLLVKGYGRDDELAADALATVFLKNVGYYRPALPAYLGRLGAAGGTGGWTATHPSPKDRIDALTKAVAGDPPAVAAGVPVREKRFKAKVGA
jgi:predicted Zn-dependent protease